MSEIDYAARVQRGAALLDERWPTWAQDIDVDTLDVSSGYRCVTAQYDLATGGDGYWDNGMERLELNMAQYAEHGFNSNEFGTGDDSVFATLNTLWRDLIQERRAQAQPEASER